MTNLLEICVVPGLIGKAPPLALAASVTVAEAARALAASGQSALALVDADGRFAALLTAEAFVGFVAGGGDAGASPALSLAQPPGDSLAAEDSALDALMLMVRRGSSHLTVLSEGGQLIGIVTPGRLLEVAEAALQHGYRRMQCDSFGLGHTEA